jgi:hypothetical protein
MLCRKAESRRFNFDRRIAPNVPFRLEGNDGKHEVLLNRPLTDVNGRPHSSSVATDIVDRSIYLRQEWYARQGFGATANLLVTAEVFRSVGGFDSRMQSSGDRLFCERIRAKSLRLGYCDTAIVSHPTRFRFLSMACKEFRIGFGFGQPARLHPGSEGYHLFAETFVVIRGVRACLSKCPSDVSPMTLALALTCYGLVRVPFRTFGFFRALLFPQAYTGRWLCLI